MPMLTTLRIAPAAVALPCPAADAVGELGHLVEHGVNHRHNVLAVDYDRCVARRPQGHMQHGAVFGHIDLLAGEHCVDARAQPGFIGEPNQERERFVGDAILRVVQEYAHCLRRQAFGAIRILGE